MKKPILLVAVIILTSNTGCASMETYFKDRALDFVDCFKADVGFGPGFEVHAAVTHLFCTGVGWSSTNRAGIKGRYAGTWQDFHAGFPFSNLFLFMRTQDQESSGWAGFAEGAIDYTECFCLGPFLPYYALVGDDGSSWKHLPVRGRFNIIKGGYRANSVLIFNYLLFNEKYNQSIEGISAFDIEVGATVAMAGFHVGVSPGQLADFLLGWFGVDIAGDDSGFAETPEKNGNKTNGE